MMILALDLATKTGFARGRAGEKPIIKSLRMKQPKDEFLEASTNVGFLILDQWRFGGLDLVCCEAPMPTGAHAGADAAALLLTEVAVARAVCRLYGIRIELVSTFDVSRHFVGRATFRQKGQEKGESRKLKKQATLQRAIDLGYLPPGCKDDDMADAAAIFDYASVRFAKVQPNFQMFRSV